MDRSSFSSCVFALFLDTFSTVTSVDVVFLDTFLDTSICRELLRIYIYALCNLVPISSISLDLSAPVHLPNTFSFTTNLFHKHSSRLIKFYSLGKLRFSHFHAFHSLKPKFLGFLQNLGFFKIKEVFL